MAQNVVTPATPFDILRRKPSGNAANVLNWQAASGTQPATGATAYVRGLILGAHPTDPEQFVLGGPTNVIGHLTRDVTVGGLTLADRVYGRTTPTPTGLAGPFTLGDSVSVELAEELEAEGPTLLMTSGVQAITSSTPVGTPLTVINGVLAVQSSVYEPVQMGYYTLAANNLQSSDGVSLRIRAVHI